MQLFSCLLFYVFRTFDIFHFLLQRIPFLFKLLLLLLKLTFFNF